MTDDHTRESAEAVDAALEELRGVAGQRPVNGPTVDRDIPRFTDPDRSYRTVHGDPAPKMFGATDDAINPLRDNDVVPSGGPFIVGFNPAVTGYKRSGAFDMSFQLADDMRQGMADVASTVATRFVSWGKLFANAEATHDRHGWPKRFHDLMPRTRAAAACWGDIRWHYDEIRNELSALWDSAPAERLRDDLSDVWDLARTLRTRYRSERDRPRRPTVPYDHDPTEPFAFKSITVT